METVKSRLCGSYLPDGFNLPGPFLVGVQFLSIQPIVWIHQYRTDHYGLDLHQFPDIVDRI